MVAVQAAPDTSLRLPAYFGADPVRSTRTEKVTTAGGTTVMEVGTAPRLVQSRMVAQAAARGDSLREPGDDDWYSLFARAADAFELRAAAGPYAEVLAAISGLPVRRVERAFAGLATDLRRMREIVAAQSPGGDVAVYRTGATGGPWAWLPAGRHVAVRVPANFPAINIEWLQAIAMRRPVLLVTGERDPVTATLLTGALYDVGLPDGAVSLCHGDAPAFWNLADQVLWPGDGAPADDGRGRVKTYHHGRSKAVVTRADHDDDTWRRLAALAVKGCGRLCTNVSSVLATNGASAVARRLAEELAAYPVRPLDDPRAIVPAFPAPDDAARIAAFVTGALRAGAVDVTAAVTGEPLVVERDGLAFLRPTVLAVDPASPVFGVELPFPFVTVAGAAYEDVPALCRDSLVVSVVDADPALVARLAAEPGVDKVYAGAGFDHGYDPLDPNEGYVADFLFRKKAVRSA